MQGFAKNPDLNVCFESDGGKNLQIEIFVLQHFFRQKNWEKNMSKNHCYSIEMTH